jgi:hypothetical protein
MTRNMQNIAKLEHLLVTTEDARTKAKEKVNIVLAKIAEDPIYKATAELEVITRIHNECTLLAKDDLTVEVDCTRIADTIRRLLIQETRYLSNRSSGTFSNIYKDFFITALSQFVDDSSYSMPFFYNAQRLDPEYQTWSDEDYAARCAEREAKEQHVRDENESFAGAIESALNNCDMGPKQVSIKLDGSVVVVRVIGERNDEITVRNWMNMEFPNSYHEDRSKRGVLTFRVHRNQVKA